ncbi:biotin synthase [Helicobacter winghamensis]|uniref:Biotin synthase n=1 Tax=Helicobacter winghamensis TaxID=157268 RepID=A0A2N3PJ64_9HELI|nr:biotin synthase [Helicobacter winghamensis]EEO25441.1 biotin synthase [Helicobacter winghamensis ATCC BAA-430]PKT78131.1 biotin synthase BioB [Helicobacter winghamensis]PKT78400.1 biotin synthase BioB [Helicobacter winghamensis]PKT78660.1 biotin synthase BioB [Helicobacter winghamensis]PKT80431.1 biotin synthase BioB [Helicobacter winghamensis]
MQEIFLCTICNVSSGSCAEDCAYCTQSAKYNADIERYKYKPIPQILEEAKRASENGALGFCLVTSGRELDNKRTEYIAQAARAIVDSRLHLHLIGCSGIASVEALRELKSAGIASYNHNLEASRNFFPKICTTHSFEERYETCENALKAGLGLCSGGIFGMGEGWQDRMDLLYALQTLNPHSVPINFFIPNPALPLTQEILSQEEALECVKLAREYLPNVRLMIAGGRERVFGENQKALFECGINAVVLGDYLTTKGNTPKDEIERIKSYGYGIAISCE